MAYKRVSVVKSNFERIREGQQQQLFIQINTRMKHPNFNIVVKYGIIITGQQDKKFFGVEKNSNKFQAI